VNGSRLLSAAVYYAVLTPLGCALRLLGFDLLLLRKNPGAKTYWIPRGRDACDDFSSMQ